MSFNWIWTRIIWCMDQRVIISKHRYAKWLVFRTCNSRSPLVYNINQIHSLANLFVDQETQAIAIVSVVSFYLDRKVFSPSCISIQ